MLRFHLHKREALWAPFIEATAPRESAWDDGAWAVVESATDAVATARAATSRMIHLLVAHVGKEGQSQNPIGYELGLAKRPR